MYRLRQEEEGFASSVPEAEAVAGSELGLQNPEQPHHRSPRHKRNAIQGIHRRWTNNEIPYEINTDMSMILYYFLFHFCYD